MYPYIEIFGINFSMMIIGCILSAIVFLITARILTKRNHQDFLKLFYWLPLRIISSYILGRYIAYCLESGTYFPTSGSSVLTILSPQNFNFHFIGLLISSRICLGIFFSSIKRTENKKIRADILFFSITNALIIFGIFLTLGDTVIGIPTDSSFAVRALSDNSILNKFDGVYPVGLFISLSMLIIHIIVSFLGIVLKKNGIGLRGLIGIIIALNLCFFFQSYPKYGIVRIVGISFDIKQYISLIVIIHGIITAIKRERKRF